MRIDKIYNRNIDYKQNNVPSFTALIKDSSALPILNSLSESDLFEFSQIEKRISKTKFWDMKISAIENKFKELKFHFINKKNSKNIITDGIYPYDRQNNTIRYYTIVYGHENTAANYTGTLKFQSEKRAQELYDTYKQDISFLRNRGFNISVLDSIKIKENELNILEEASGITQDIKDTNIKSSEIELKSTVGNGLTHN